jgi:hypothetical protein
VNRDRPGAGGGIPDWKEDPDWMPVDGVPEVQRPDPGRSARVGNDPGQLLQRSGVRFRKAVFPKIWDGEQQAVLPETEEPVPRIGEKLFSRGSIGRSAIKE